ncbi:MAG: 2-hydroxychromene-2-carboxylate isomerase [Hydrogenophilus thermoluteolus]
MVLDFYFDFSSPFGYLMAEMIEEVAQRHHATVVWRPFLLGAVYQKTGDKPLPAHPLKGPYMQRDFARSARFYGIPFRLPDPFPVSTHLAARAFYALNDGSSETAKRWAIAVYRAYFRDGRNIADAETLTAIAHELGLDADALGAAMQSPEEKARLRAECDAAIERGVFGSPMVWINDEPFWGVDRLPQIERWLAEGPF